MKPAENERKYDVVIIGSGLAGLVCGSILSKEGKKVCIIEKNEQLGGSLQTFRRDGVKFDTGVHYIGGLDKGQNLYQFFTYLGIMDRLSLQRMDAEGFDVVLFKDDPMEYPFGMGYDNFIRVLSERFPDDKETIVTYCKELKRICDSFPLYNLRTDQFYSDTTIFKRSIKQYLEELTPNEKLRNVLGGTNLLYAGVGDKTPLYVHALVLNSYIESSWKCTQGSDQISNLIAKSIRAMGGDIFRKKKVTNIHVEDGEAQYVLLEDGTRIFADTFISNVNPARTLQMADTEKFRKAYRSRIQSLENSISVFVLYAIMKPGAAKYQNRNYYYYDEVDVWKCVDYTEETWPYTYAMFECVPHHQNEYTEAITVMSYMRYDEVKQWADTFNTTTEQNDRGSDYDKFKHAKAEKLLDTIEVKFPGIRNQIQSYYTSTPLSYRDYIGSEDGNMYGILKDFNDPLRSFISPKTKVPNLLLTGQNVNLHGVLGVTVSAVLTCGMILGKEYLLEKIVAASADTIK